MKELKELVLKIDEMRKYLNDLIKEKGNLLDYEVVVASQMLDSILNEYHKILDKKVDK